MCCKHIWVKARHSHKFKRRLGFQPALSFNYKVSLFAQIFKAELEVFNECLELGLLFTLNIDNCFRGT